MPTYSNGGDAHTFPTKNNYFEISSAVLKDCILFQNVRSLNANYDKLKDVCMQIEEMPLAICCQEIWQPHTSNYHLQGYAPMVAHTRKGQRNVGGGVGIFVRSDCPFVEICLPDTFIEHIFEAQYVYLESLNVIIGNVYRPPSSPYKEVLQYLEKNIQSLALKFPSSKMYIGGDYNINFLATSEQTESTLDTLESLGFRSLIKHPTRVSDHSCTLIDTIFTNSTQKHESGVIVTDISDHYGIFVRLCIKAKHAPKVISYRKMGKQQLKEFRKTITDTNWSFIKEEECPATALNKKIESILDETCPIITRKLNKQLIQRSHG